MTSDSLKLHSRVATLNNALDDLEAQLEPLFSQTLPESVVGLETIQQAKLQVALPYLVYDLIFIYLKTRGIDPKSHPVVAELDRIRQYFDKIKNAEDPAKRATTVDKAAANRFIKHAIAQVKAQRSPGDDEGPSNIRFSEGGDVRIPIKVTSKMEARAQYQKELAELGSEEEEGLEVIEDADDTEKDGPSDASRPDNGRGSGKGKGKAKAVDVDVQEASATTSGRKRRRPQVDPFAGYGDEASEHAQDSEAVKHSRVDAASAELTMADNADNSSGPSTHLSAAEVARKEKKAAKKAKKKARQRESVG